MENVKTVNGAILNMCLEWNEIEEGFLLLIDMR